MLAGVGDLDGVEREAVAPDPTRALDRAGDREPVARRVVQDVERLAVAQHLADMLLVHLAADVDGPVQLDAVEEEQA